MSGVAAMEWPLHMIDPSGQYAVGQLCTGMDLPSAVLSENESLFCTLPFGHGTPQLTFCRTAGGWPSSQLSWTGATGWALAERAKTANASKMPGRAMRAAVE